MHGSVNERTEFLFRDFVIPAAGQTGNMTPEIINPKMALVGLVTPAALVSTTVTFEVSLDRTTWIPVYDKLGVQYSVAVGTDRYIILPPWDVCGWQFVRLLAGSAETDGATIKGVFRVV